jgi:hypothetical protein
MPTFVDPAQPEHRTLQRLIVQHRELVKTIVVMRTQLQMIDRIADTMWSEIVKLNTVDLCEDDSIGSVSTDTKVTATMLEEMLCAMPQSLLDQLEIRLPDTPTKKVPAAMTTTNRHPLFSPMAKISNSSIPPPLPLIRTGPLQSPTATSSTLTGEPNEPDVDSGSSPLSERKRKSPVSTVDDIYHQVMDQLEAEDQMETVENSNNNNN